MEPYSIKDRIKVIQEHYKTGEKIKNTFLALRDHFGRHNRSNETTIGRLVRKFEETGSIGDLAKSGKPKNVRKSQNIAAVKENLRESPKLSVSRRSQELGISSIPLI